ncbi:mobile genetic element [Streptococcus pneumoniae]|nr:mobile genetic element [Streptococcus pneumoniae]
MNDEASKQLTDARFKRLVGVQRTTFKEMLEKVDENLN